MACIVNKVYYEPVRAREIIQLEGNIFLLGEGERDLVLLQHDITVEMTDKTQVNTWSCGHWYWSNPGYILRLNNKKQKSLKLNCTF